MAGELPYTEFTPPADLAPFVDRLWLRSTAGGAGAYRVLPDGCVDVIVHADRGGAELVGAMTRAVEIADAPAELVAVRFRPGTAAAIAGCALAELTDRSIAVADLGIAADLAGRVSEAAPAARMAVLVSWLRGRLAGAEPPDALVGEAVARLAAGGRVEDIAGALGVSRQYLARSFRRDVGLTPKQLVRIARMQRAAAAINRVSRTGGLARLAVELGYFDQAHLTSELRALSGITPAALAAEQPLALSHLFR